MKKINNIQRLGLLAGLCQLVVVAIQGIVSESDLYVINYSNR